MSFPARHALPLLFGALLASGCSGNSPPAPLVAAAGWSFDPARAGDHPLPVIWWDSSTPELLPLLPGGDCAASGSVQAMVVPSANQPVLAGISATCSGAGQATMRPALWTRSASGAFAIQALGLPDRSTQGTALALDQQNGNVFVGGAVGVESPFPMVWKNGQPSLAISGTVLPAGYDSGIVTAIRAGENFVIAGGVVHRTGSSPPAYSAVLWILDPDFTAVVPELLPLPPDAASASSGPSVALEIQLSTVVSAVSLSTAPGLDKPVVYFDTTPTAPAGLDFTTAPFGVPTGLWSVGGTPYLSGFIRPAGSGGLPSPVLWGGTSMANLSTADPSLGLGAGEALAILYEHAYVAGETYATQATDPTRLLSVPAWWDNGNRQDLAGLAAPGTGPALSRPLFGWWRLPGTPMTAPPDWPYVGGFAEIGAGTARVSAAGSGVAKAIVVTPR
jgi:hypothetical protein